MSYPEICETISPRLRETLASLFESGSSEAYAVADCLNMIAMNGEDSTTDAFLLCCAEELQHHAQTVIDVLRDPQIVAAAKLRDAAPALLNALQDLLSQAETLILMLPRGADDTIVRERVQQQARDAIHKAGALLPIEIPHADDNECA